MRRAFITGIGGQDGSYLAELLIEAGYVVTGLVRPGAEHYPNLEPLQDSVELLEADLLDRDSLARALEAARPDEVYNLAAPSFVPASWDRPVNTIFRVLMLAGFLSVAGLVAYRKLIEPLRLPIDTDDMALAVEKEFGIRLDEEELDCDSLDDMAAYVEKLVAKKPG